MESVNQVIDIASDDIEEAPSFGTSIRTDFIAGMGRINGKFVVILNTGRVLSFDDIAKLGRPVLAAAAAAAA